ncbi:MAG: N-6 DNA methylase, partial [Calditrichota bacterium]
MEVVTDQEKNIFSESRAWGDVSTPPWVIEKMVEWSEIADLNNLQILEPACGDAPFIQYIQDKYTSNNHLYYGVEINPERINKMKLRDSIRLFNQDFLLWNSDESFDLIIGNPPYGIIGDSTHYPIHVLKQFKEQYKKIFLTWRGKYNIYGAFLEKSVSLLKKGGKIAFIIPGTWLLLDDFIDLRRSLAAQGRLRIHYLGSVFHQRNVVAVVVIFTKGNRGLELWEGDSPFRSWENYSG